MRKLFVMGGGGFAMESDNLLLDHYLLSLTNKKNPKICFLGTASGDGERYRDNFYSAYRKMSCTPCHLSLFKPHTRDIEGFILEQDIIHVGGGNTRNLLVLWKEWRLDQILRKAYEAEVVLSGMSAGMICWFEEFITDSFGGKLEKLNGLGWLKGSAVPHLDGEIDRYPVYSKLVENNEISAGIGLDDGVGVLYLNETLNECVSSRQKGRGFYFERKDSKLNINALNVKYLGV